MCVYLLRLSYSLDKIGKVPKLCGYMKLKPYFPRYLEGLGIHHI